MALHKNILQEIQDGKMPEIFTIGDLKKTPLDNGRFLVGREAYGLSTLNTTPANLSVDADGSRSGKHVQYGASPQYIRLGRGKYRLICDKSILEAPAVQEEIELESLDEVDLCHFNAEAASGFQSIPEFIADYLHKTPYQLFFKKQKIKHPAKPASGMPARLQAYFWPDLAIGWEKTQQEIQKFIAAFQSIELTKESHETADKLLALFSEICKWGGVKLPEISAADLKQQVFTALDTLDAGGVPAKYLKINSAYTKLYAIARPDSFVIYDSRVAAALTSIIDTEYQTMVSLPDWFKYKELGFVTGRGGSRPRLLHNVWKNGYQKWSAQISANLLCLDIVRYINQDPLRYGLTQQITLRELEAMLFMEGY